ncbi:MAG: hypothetical protein JSV79_02550 [Armatimonadota bacterium]|nr:MAG: hypothetical protein JSV79_02550 [Armatimonadota bacterium]
MTPERETTQLDDARPVPWSRRRPKLAAAAYILSYLLIAVIGGSLAAVAPSLAVKVAVVVVSAAAALALSLLLLLSICRFPTRPGAEVAWIFAMMIIFCLARPVALTIVARLLGHPAAGKTLADLFTILPGQELLGNAALIIWAAFLGKLVSRVVREGKLFLPVALVASIADIVTVFWGPVKTVTEVAPEVAQTFSASAPVAAPPEVATPILAAVGIGDFLFLAVFLAAALRHSMPAVKTMWAAFAIMLLAPLTFLLFPAEYVPGLPFIAAAVLWANWRHLKFTREEKRALAFAGALVAAATVGIWTLLRK